MYNYIVNLVTSANKLNTTGILLTIIGVLLWYLHRHLYSGRTFEMMEKIPGPKITLFFGNILEALIPPEKRMDLLQEWDKKYGPIYRTYMGPWLPNVHIMKPEYAEAILNNNRNLMKGSVYLLLSRWLKEGLLTTTGDRWFKHRKFLTPAFHFQVLDNFIDVYNANSQILLAKIKEKAEKYEADVFPLVTNCALDIICECAMGIKINAQQAERSEYASAVHKLISLSLERGTKIWYHLDQIYFNIPPGREYMKTVNYLHQFAEKVIKERRQTRNTGKEGTKVAKKKALLDLMLDAAEEQGIEATDEAIREEVDTFMFAGHDTTTAAISWAILMMAIHPDIQEQAYQEQKHIFADDITRPVTMKDLSEMKVLERIIKECLRIFPSVPLISRTAEEDTVVGKHTIPKGVQIIIHIFSMHRDPKVFPNPLVFNPDNFLLENTKNRHPYAYIPFSAGSRNCIGQKFALLEEKTVLSTLIRNVRFESQQTLKDIHLLFEIILRPDGGARVKAVPRKH